MTVLRSEIEKALDDLISNEEGMRFQGLAVVLAKKHWPDLVACERKKDRGADAIGDGRALACSITARLQKIKDDATEIKNSFGGVKTLVFATPKGVTNTTAQKWAREIEREFGYELLVMSREDIITSLQDPENAPLCRTHLGLHVVSEPDVEALLVQTREAVAEVARAWLVRLSGTPFIELRCVKVNHEGQETAEIYHLNGIQLALEKGERVVMQAPAGRGKTTTLVHLTANQNKVGGVALLVDLPVWIESGRDILQFISGMQAFRSRDLTPERLATLQKAEHFSFLLNGWNEISETDSQRAVHALRELDRNFPSAGILVATRIHHIDPPLRGSLRLRLLALNRAERRRYLTERLASRADVLASTIDSDSTLDDLTRIPLMLSEVTTLFEAGVPIPKSKLGVLKETIRLNEKREEHSAHLMTAPLFARSSDYLTGLAMTMGSQGAVGIPEDAARTQISLVSKKLHEAGQTAAPQEPSAILNTLCAHHVLERITYPLIAYRFDHQQFQEFYAAVSLREKLTKLARTDNANESREFAKTYVNKPEWAEPLRMVAEEIGVECATPSSGTNLISAGAILVRTALVCDPVYAAELSHLCGPLVWQQIRTDLTTRLRTLYQSSDECCRELALAGMLATGSEEFRDILLPLLESQSEQTRLRTYRMWHQFHLSTLGSDWTRTIASWNEEVRADFVSDMLHFGKAVRKLAAVALADSSVKVRAAAVSALAWISSREDLARVVASLDDETFGAVLPKLDVDELPSECRIRAETEYRKQLNVSSDPQRRLQLLAALAELGVAAVTSEIKIELVSCSPEMVKKLGDSALRPILEIVRREDVEWVSQWLVNRIIDGTLWHETWIALVTCITPELRERLLCKLETEDLENTRYQGSISILAASANAALAQRVFARLCQLRQVIAAAPEQRHELERSIERQLEELFRKIPPNTAIEGLLPVLSGEVKSTELLVISELIGRVDEDSQLRSNLDEKLSRGLRDYLVKGVPNLLKTTDFYGNQKAYWALAMAQVGRPEDLAFLREMILADIDRVRRGREARLKGDKTTLGNGGTTSYANWHVRAVSLLAPDSGDVVLLELLKETAYERDAAAGLAALACEPKSKAIFFRAHNEYAKVWEARAGNPEYVCQNAGRRLRYATAVADRIGQILAESESVEEKAGYAFRLGELTKSLAQMDIGSTDLILRALSIPGRFNGWAIVQTLEILLFNGAKLPTEITLKLFDAIESQARPHLYNDQEVGLLVHALCLLPFVDNPPAGIEKVRHTVRDLKLRTYQLRDLATALGHSRCAEAFSVLCELAMDDLSANQLGDAWLNAMATLDTSESRRLLLGTVDAQITGAPCNVLYDQEETLAARLVELVQRDSAIKSRLLELCSATSITAAEQSLLSRVMSGLGTPDATFAALNLIDDRMSPAIPFETWRQIERAFVEHKPDSRRSHVYTLASQSSNEVRLRLFEMATSDERRMKSASSLLAQIECWRLEYGRPLGEPRHPALESGTMWPPTSHE